MKCLHQKGLLLIAEASKQVLSFRDPPSAAVGPPWSVHFQPFRYNKCAYHPQQVSWASSP